MRVEGQRGYSQMGEVQVCRKMYRSFRGGPVRNIL